MDIRHVLLAALATLPLSGCPSTWNCNPPEEQFDIDETLTAEQLDQIVADYGLEGRDAIECETACRQAYRNAKGWETGEVSSCNLTLPADPDDPMGEAQITCAGTGYEYFCEGRRPLAHVEDGDENCASALGRSLAAMAYLEAASVDAFEELAVWLEARGAPEELISRCREAADDERDHARWMRALAEAHGAAVPAPSTTNELASPIDLLTVAEHNAREGCVHETFAALMAGHRARSASDLRLRRVFARIATDETRHAQLAWDLDAWLRTQLEDHDVERVEVARAEALTALPLRARGLAQLPAELGVLSPAEAERLATELRDRLAA